MSGRHSASCYL